MSETYEADRGLVRSVLARDAGATRQLLARLSPVVRVRVARVLLRHAAHVGRAPRPEDIDDLQHDVFLVLFDRDGRVLRAWDAARGLSLENFVGLVAQREAGAILRSGRRSAWAENPTSDAEDDEAFGVEAQTPEHQVATREELAALLNELRDRLSPRSLALFEALYAEHESAEEICARFDMTPNALYIFRNRLKATVAEIRLDLSGGDSAVARSSSKRVTS